MKHYTTTQPKRYKHHACALLVLFLWMLPSLASAQALTISPEPTEGFVDVVLVSTGGSLASCGMRERHNSFGCNNPNGGRVIELTLTATANAPYQFVGWSGDASCSGTSASFTITPTKDITCSPHFIRAPYTQVSVGGDHQCALLSNGGIQCWGTGSNGRLGNGASSNSSTPVTVQGISTAAAVVTGKFHSCALLTDGKVQCWGNNGNGELGIGGGSGSNSNVPVNVASLSGIKAISTGKTYNCAILASDQIACWGFNSQGALGLGFYSGPTPSTLSGITNAMAISAGELNTCALLQNKKVQCWGNNSKGQLGVGTTGGKSSTPTTSVSNLDTAIAISAGNQYNCALLQNKKVQCWGWNNNGQLGNSTNTNSNIPVEVSNLDNVSAISAGNALTCALLDSGAVKCWGTNSNNALGVTGITSSNTPVDVRNISTAIAISNRSDSRHTTCAILTDGNAYCWGQGYGATPTAVPGQPGVPTPSATISLYSHSLFIAASPYRTIPGTVSNNLPTWLTYSASAGVFFGIPTSAASGITITPGSNPPFPVSPARFSIAIISQVPTTITIIDASPPPNAVAAGTAAGTVVGTVRLIAEDQAGNTVPVVWSGRNGVFAVGADGTIKTVQNLNSPRNDLTVTAIAGFPIPAQLLFQPDLKATTGTQKINIAVTAASADGPLILHVKTFLEGPLQ